MWLKWDNLRWYRFRVTACLKVVTSGVFCLASQQILGMVSPFYHYLYVMGFGVIFFSHSRLYFSKFLPSPHIILTVRENKVWLFVSTYCVSWDAFCCDSKSRSDGSR